MVLKVFQYHGDVRKKSRSSGVRHIGITTNIKNADLGTYIKGNIGESPKMIVSGYFLPQYDVIKS